MRTHSHLFVSQTSLWTLFKRSHILAAFTAASPTGSNQHLNPEVIPNQMLTFRFTKSSIHLGQARLPSSNCWLLCEATQNTRTRRRRYLFRSHIRSTSTHSHHLGTTGSGSQAAGVGVRGRTCSDVKTCPLHAWSATLSLCLSFFIRFFMEHEYLTHLIYI